MDASTANSIAFLCIGFAGLGCIGIVGVISFNWFR